MKLALLLPNQGVVFGATTVGELMQLAEIADRSGVFDAVCVGDNLLAKPRLESVTTLAALAGRTRRVRLGVACMASFPLRNPIVLAAQWGALDNLAEGRTLLIACIGGGAAKAQIAGDFDAEYAAFGVRPSERAARLEEGIAVLRTLWSQDPATHHGRFYDFEGISVRPAPVHKPTPPIWIANNPHIFGARPDIVRRTVERVGRLADGWMTVLATPEEFRRSWAAIGEAARAHGRDPACMEAGLYYNLCIDDDRERGFRESKRFLDEYYSQDYAREAVDKWGGYGSPAECAEQMLAFAAAGVQLLNVRFASYDQMGQMRRFTEEVVPLLD